MKFKFDNKMFKAPFAPFYNRYKDHEFVIDHYHPEDELQQHVFVKCVDDPELKVDGYVDIRDLVKL